MSVLDLAGTEWVNPKDAASADVASQKRLMAVIICAILDLTNQISECETRMSERKMQVDLDNLRAAGIFLSSLLKSEGVV
jgi:hypothetical protein